MPEVNGPPQTSVNNMAPGTDPRSAALEILATAPAAADAPPIDSSVIDQTTDSVVYGAVTDGWNYSANRELRAYDLVRSVMLLVLNGVALALYILGFSAIGYGVNVFDAIDDYYSTAVMCVGGSMYVR